MIDLLRRRMAMGLMPTDIIIKRAWSDNDAALMDVIYAQGWSKSPKYMTKREAEAVTDIGTAFRGNTNIVDFSAFQYFVSCTALVDSAFSGCRMLNKIILPEGMTNIAQYTFSYCEKLTNVNLPISITSLENQNFIDCSSLVSIALPPNLKKIGYGVFLNCSKLESIHLPKTITSINSTAFQGCANISNITVDHGGSYSDNGGTALIKGTSLLVGGLKTVIPSGITTIGSGAFSSRVITNMIIPNSVTTIDSYAFMNCSKLASVSFGNSLSEIKYRSFYGCTALNRIELPRTVKSISDNAFMGTSNLKIVVLNAEIPPAIYGNNTFHSATIIYVPEVTDAYKGLDESINGYSYLANLYNNGQIKSINELSE